jgi:hypothetical protein
MAAMVTCGPLAPSGDIPMHCRRLSRLPPQSRGGVERGVGASISMVLPPSLASKQADTAGTATTPSAAGGGGSSSPAASGGSRRRLTFEQRYRQLELFSQQHGHTLVPVREESGEGLATLGAVGRLPFSCFHKGTEPASHPPTAKPPTSSLMDHAPLRRHLWPPSLQAWACGWPASGMPGRRAGCRPPGSSSWRRWASVATLSRSHGPPTSASWRLSTPNTATAACPAQPGRSSATPASTPGCSSRRTSGGRARCPTTAGGGWRGWGWCSGRRRAHGTSALRSCCSSNR